MPTEASSSDAVAIQVTVAVAVIDGGARSLADELRRHELEVALGTADVLRTPPELRVYVFCFDAALAVALAEPIVHWAHGVAGVIGVIPDGGGPEREALLAAGFDDVIAGKLSIRELSARIRSVHRRMHRTGSSTGRIRFGAFALDLPHRTLWVQGRAISLTQTELAVMRALIEARGRPLSRIELLDAVWGGGELEVTERAVDNVILRIRRKLTDPDALETVRAVGFRLR